MPELTAEQNAQNIAAQASLAIKELTTEEMATLNIAIVLEYETITHVKGYAKVAHLFTENQGNRMHQLTRQGWDAAVRRRLQAEGL